MSTKSIFLESTSRTDKNGSHEELTFEKGVNVIVGEPNTGKTRWLETIDFILGDDGTPEEKLGEDIFDKYVSATVSLLIDNRPFVVERRWREPGFKTKIFVNDTAYDIGEFRQLLLERLDIPTLHYPQGSPYSTRTWPELGWRSLVRHLYRRQRLWNDIADKQPESEQHACILQFLGIAEVLFSDEYGELVRKQKEIVDLESRRAHFVETLNEVSREIISEDELGIAVTPAAITLATNRLKAEIDQLNTDRTSFITAAIGQAQQSLPARDAVSQMTEEFATLKEAEKGIAVELERLNSRLADVGAFQKQVDSEISRLERAQKAGDVLANLKVTHCPACDQEVKKPLVAGAECYLCGQDTTTAIAATKEPLKRLEFELDQLKGERKENTELLESLTGKKRSREQNIQDLRNRSARLTELLKPVRVATAAIIPPQVAELDNEIGRRVERTDQLRRIRESLSRREKIAAEIMKIQAQVETLLTDVAKQTLSIDFETASDTLSDFMNEYVSLLKFDKDRMWSQKDIQFNLKKDGFTVRVGRQRWTSQLGGTMVIYFLLSYHYALLKLSIDHASRVPGLLILDFPAEIEGKKVADHENFVMVPFIGLCASEGYGDLQVIAAGSAFDRLTGVHRIEFKKVWAG